MTDKPINKRRHWSREDCLLLLELDSAKPRPTHQALADRFGGLTAHAVAMKLVKLRQGQTIPKARPPQPEKLPAKPKPEIPFHTKMQIHRTSRSWAPAEDAKVLARCPEGEDAIHALTIELGRTYYAIRQRYHNLKKSAGKTAPDGRKTVVMQATAAQATASRMALRYASPFGEMLGEPPIGRSALDQKRAGTSA